MLHLDVQKQSRLSADDLRALAGLRRRSAEGIILSTALAGSGHPGGSLSTLDALLVLYAALNVAPGKVADPDRDRIIVSHGHISPGVYAVLAAFGFCDEEEFLLGFRRTATPFAGHVESSVPGVEWNSGNLGQGLSVGCGAALAGKLQGREFRTVVLMGDGEQQKGQLSEARRFAVKYGLSRLLGIVDWNRLQLSGPCDEIMPQQIAAGYAADGWNVLELDGHDYQALYGALRKFVLGEVAHPAAPTVILARTVMSQGVPFMENLAKFHGMATTPEETAKALQALGGDPARYEALKAKRAALKPAAAPAAGGDHRETVLTRVARAAWKVETGKPRLYGPDGTHDCRGGFGNALTDLAELNNRDGSPNTKVVGLTCDIAGSVRLNGIQKATPKYYLDAGIQEHHAAAFAGRLSKEGFCVFFSTFGAFAVDEVYNQNRLSDINQTNLKVVATHCGIDVGEDGPTHQAIDYIGVFGSFFGFRIVCPADVNQTDRVIRAIAAVPGNCFVGFGRSKYPVLLKEDGSIYYDEKHVFTPGQADLLRPGKDAAILAIGPMVFEAVKVHEALKKEGLAVAVWNMASVRPLDQQAIRQAAATGAVITAEDHHVETGLGARVAAVLAEANLSPKFRRCGVPGYQSSGKPSELYARCGLDAAGLAAAVRGLKGKK